MSRDEFLQKALRERNIYPPSVQDSHYGDQAILTRGEVIEKTLKEMGLLLPSEMRAHPGDDPCFLAGVITELQHRLPYGNIKTCGAFKHLNAGCCDSCHTACPYYEMSLIDLPEGGKAWVCENIELAIFPERYPEFTVRAGNSALFSTVIGHVACFEN